MSIFDMLRQRRRERIIKAALAGGLTVPSRRALTGSWLPRWIRGDYTMRNSELIFSAVSRISNTLSAMPAQLFRGSDPVQSPLNDLLRRAPNPNMTASQFFKTLEACRCTGGNAYAIKEFDANGELARLDPLDPARVTPVLETGSGELWYQIQPEEGQAFLVHSYYVLHIPFISTNGYTGISPVSVLLDTLKYADGIQTFSAKQLEQGVNAAIVLEAPANLGEAQKATMVKNMMETYRETSGNILLLESGVTAKTLNLSPIDTNLLEVEKITRSKVAMVYNIPPHLLGDYSNTSFTSQEQQMLEFLTLTMLPIVTAYEQEMDRKLLTKRQRSRGYHWELDMETALRADAATRAEVNYKAIRSGWRTPDEIRAAYGISPLPGGIGKYAMISQDMATLQYTVLDKPRVLMAKLDERETTEEEAQN